MTGSFAGAFCFMPVGNPSMLHVNLESRLAVQGSDEHPKPPVMPVAVTDERPMVLWSLQGVCVYARGRSGLRPLVPGREPSTASQHAALSNHPEARDTFDPPAGIKCTPPFVI